MAAKKKTTKKHNDPAETANVPQIVKQVAPAIIIEQKGQQFDDIETPDFLKDDMIEDEAPTGFNPLIDFQDEPGRWIVAKYIGTRMGVGPNSSSMYDFEAYNPESRQTVIVSLWGSTILDKKMDLLVSKGSLLPGKFCFVQYLGAVNTNRGLNPAKNFKIIVIKDGALDKYYQALKSA
jgi:hypothetical protein